MKKVCATCKHDGVEPCNEPCILCRFGSDGIPTEWEYAKNYEPQTNADRIRAMTDEELAKFIATKIVNLENHKMIEQGHTPTATQLSALGHTCYCTLVQWLQQPAEGENK